MNPENSQQNTVEEVAESTGVTRKFYGTGPVARFVQSDAMKPVLENDIVKSLEAWNLKVAQRFGMSPNGVTATALIIVLLLLSLVMRVDTLHVSLAAEVVKPGGKYVTNSFVHMIFVDLILIGLIYALTRFKTGSDALSFVPSGVQNIIEMVFEYLYDLCESVAGHNARRFAPWCMTLFFFILVSNWSGLIPGVGTIGVYHEYHAAEGDHGGETDHADDSHGEEGEDHGEEGEGDGHGEEEEGEGDGQGQSLDAETMAATIPLGNQIAMSDGKIIFASAESMEAGAAAATEGEKTLIPILRPPTASLNFTFAIAIMTMVIVQYYGFKKLGAGYLKKFFTFSGDSFGMKCINCFVGILELVSELSRILSFAFRLFGNIFAGEVMLATMAFLVTFILPVPFYFLELFVGFVQALVFMMLALIFFTLAEQSHGDEHH